LSGFGLICGDALLELQKQPEASVDAVITDPPYGYSFMGKDWDRAVPPVEIWEECLRVLKPGGWCMVLASPRQDVLSRMMVRLEDAGFRTDFTSIYWTYATGFPKASNIGKKVDKRLGAEVQTFKAFNMKGDPEGKLATRREAKENYNLHVPQTPEAQALAGCYGGFQPKPAVEVIIVAMKPLSEKTFVEQALKNGKGVTWMDGCRIPYKSERDAEGARWGSGKDHYFAQGTSGFKQLPDDHLASDADSGRFPANLLVSDDVLNDGQVFGGGTEREGFPGGTTFGGSERNKADWGRWYGDIGSFSRYFDLDAWDKAARETFPFLIVPKPAKSEKSKGCASVVGEARFSSQNESGKMLPTAMNEPHSVTGNYHPTVKPLKLMRYLITLTTREGDTVLDPFVGSGTTCVAAKELNREYIGIDREAEYIEIANSRLAAAGRQPSLDFFAPVGEAANG